MRIKTKLSIGLGFLFIVILAFGILGIFSVNRLRNESDRVLRNNYETLVYCNNMLTALNAAPADTTAWQQFDVALSSQEKNLTEPGEKILTATLRNHFERLKSMPADDSARNGVLSSLQQISELNLDAILSKNQDGKTSTDNSITWLTIFFTLLTLIAFTLVVNFPAVLGRPVKALSDGLSGVARKDYSRRIHLDRDDEFGELASAFNAMTEKLDEYEHSNLAKITFEKRRIETIINQMKDAIIGLDEKRNILFLNSVASSLLNLRETVAIGKYAPDLALNNDLLRTLLREESVNELKIYADKKESYFNREVLRVTNEDELIGEVIVLRNVTPFHELDEAKTNFIASVSHELKTPIASILMSTQLLEDERVGSISQEQKELLGNIKDDTGRLLRITRDLLNLTQVEAGKIQLAIQAVSATDIVSYATEATESLARQKEIIVVNEIPVALPMVNADKEKTSWVLTNLVTNAIRYSFEKSKVIIQVSVEQSMIKFSVQDFGSGIDPQYQDRVFDRYFRVPGTREEGTGLGLAICREFVEAQGGKIYLQSEYGSGSRFVFELAKTN